MKIALLLISLILLAACGAREPLQYPQAEGEASGEAAEITAKDTADLLATTPDARPQRVDETLRRSRKREDDPFDAPPPK